MKLTLNTEVTGVTVELSLIEAIAFVKKPDRVQTEVRSMLNGGGITIPGYGAAESYPVTEPETEPETEVCPHCHVHFRKLGIHLGKGCKQDPEYKAH